MQSKIYRDGPFEYGYVRSPKQLNCTMLPTFRPHWWAQYLRDGTSEIFNTKAECLAWIAEWREIWRDNARFIKEQRESK